jgi:hypothetical protein
MICFPVASLSSRYSFLIFSILVQLDLKATMGSFHDQIWKMLDSNSNKWPTMIYQMRFKVQKHTAESQKIPTLFCSKIRALTSVKVLKTV